ncbi:MAG: hypothetical protein V2I74_12470 [Erythrobacter sp.]|nr:hypothetical protein [Erythrobacter sp.]
MKKPRIPMSPSELPQQRLVLVVDLEPRPDPFDVVVDYGARPPGVELPNGPSNPEYLCQAEWSWSPMHSRVDAYYLSRGRTHWMLWSYWYDDNWGKWDWTPVAYVPRRQATARQAAVHLLIEFWKFDREQTDLNRYHWINASAFLSVAELREIAHIVWPDG